MSKKLFYKESLVYLLTLGLINIFLFDSIIDIYELTILCCLSPVYLFAGYYYSKGPVKEKEDDLQNQNTNNSLHLYIPNNDSMYVILPV